MILFKNIKTFWSLGDLFFCFSRCVLDEISLYYNLLGHDCDSLIVLKSHTHTTYMYIHIHHAHTKEIAVSTHSCILTEERKLMPVVFRFSSNFYWKQIESDAKCIKSSKIYILIWHDGYKTNPWLVSHSPMQTGQITDKREESTCFNLLLD